MSYNRKIDTQKNPAGALGLINCLDNAKSRKEPKEMKCPTCKGKGQIEGCPESQALTGKEVADIVLIMSPVWLDGNGWPPGELKAMSAMYSLLESIRDRA
jgi:hypothetical protein